MSSDVNEVCRHLSDAMAENEKLRELVKDIWTSCPISEKDCESCEHQNGESYAGCKLCDRMRGLGIEV